MNLSASDETTGKPDIYRQGAGRRTVGKDCSARDVYASAGDGESTQDVVYSGHNLIAENGRIASGVGAVRRTDGVICTEIDVHAARGRAPPDDDV